MSDLLANRLRPMRLEAVHVADVVLFLFVLPIFHTTTIRLACLFSATLIALVLVHRHGMPVLPLKIPFALWGIIALVSLVSAVDPWETLSEIKSEVLYSFLAFFVFYTQTTNQRRWVVWIAAVIAILLALSITNVFLWYRGGDLVSPRYVYNGVAAYTTFLVTVLPFVLLLVFHFPTPGFRGWLLRAAPLLLIVPAYLTLNRTVWIAVATLALIMSGLLMFSNGSRSRNFKAAVALTALVVISFNLIHSTLERRVGLQGKLDAIVQHTVAVDPRTELWSFAKQEILRNPWQGIGFGTASFSVAYEQWKSKGILHAHNVFLDAGIQMGVPGIVAMGVLFGAVLYQYWRLYRSRNRLVQWLGAAGIAMVVAVVIRNMTDEFFRRDLALLFWALVGASLGYGHRILAQTETKRLE